MADIATRLPGLLRPDASRTVLRPFMVEDPSSSDCPRTRRIIDRILALDDAGLRDELQVMAVGLQDRHRDVDRLLQRRYEELGSLMTDRAPATPDQCRLIGAYFSEEFSFESAALFNLSVRWIGHVGVARRLQLLAVYDKMVAVHGSILP